MQIPEGMISKVITNSEEEILDNQDDAGKIAGIVRKLSPLARMFGDESYASAIEQLADQIKDNNRRKNQFLASIKNLGLYFEVANFTNFKLDELLKMVENDFNCKVNEDIVVPRKTLQYMREKMDCDVELPKTDLILRDKFVAPIYTLKLKQEAKQRLSARDFGSYKSTSKQPIQGRNNGTLISQASKIGQMELINSSFIQWCMLKNFVNSGKLLTGNAEDNPEPSFITHYCYEKGATTKFYILTKERRIPHVQ